MTAGRASILIFTFSVSILTAQTISVETREVVVDVTVTNSKGGGIADLRKEDFTLTDDGKPRAFEFTITSNYEPISGQPGPLGPLRGPSRPAASGGPSPETGHSTAIILDEVNGYSDELVFGRYEVKALMAKAPENERIAIYTIVRNKGLILLQDYTTDRDLLRQALVKNPLTGARPAGSGHFYQDQPVPPDIAPPLNAEEAAAMWRNNSESARLSLQAFADQLTLVPGRKTMFWLTAGFNPWILGLGNSPPPGSPVSALNGLKPLWEKTFLALNQANVAVNVIDERGVYAASNPVTGTIAIMQEIADRTGGRAYFSRNDVGAALEEGILATRATYTLRFQLSDEDRDKRFHPLKVTVNRKDLKLYYRQGYDSGGTQRPDDLVAGRVEGKALEARASDAAPLDAFVQLPWFYTGTNRASVHFAVALQSAPREPVEIVGIALRPDGSEVARFADRIPADAGGRYEHPFTLASGSYTFRLTAGSGTTVPGTKDIPLNIEPWSSGTFEIGGVVLSREIRPAIGGPPQPGALIVGGKEFVPAADTRFGKSERAYFYNEIYDATNAAALTVRYRIFEDSSVEAKFDSGVARAASFTQPGKSVIPFAANLPVAQLPPGKYRLEVQAGHVASEVLITRVVHFEVTP